MGFRLTKRPSSVPENPEALFRDLRNRTVEGLLSQQADMLRAYMKHVDDSDIALQMPTGSGKTLVGLLIAEWRRRKLRQRVIYLCPTRQLVNQVVEQAIEKYGLRALPFVGSKREYAQADKSEYLNAEVLAVTTYSGLFNTSPFFDNAQLILCDDAHAAENYIAEFWSLCVEKWNTDHTPLFDALLSVLRDDIPVTDYSRLSGDSDYDDVRQWVNMLPAPVLHSKHDELFQVFEAHCTSGTQLGFKWQVLRDHLKACHLYYGWGRFLVRPLIPPTESHAPFANAVQRVYMSATLGEGGELERLVGKHNIIRIPAPEGWDKQGIGRRLFFFPMKSLEEDESDELVVKMTSKAGRALVLTPREREASLFRELVATGLPDFTVFGAADIEASKSGFVSTDKAIAIVANRYDGIDLVGNECRLLVASGLPRATNLQEQFLITRLAASILYNDRIRTRIVQATGRCTRSATDYAAVVILGEQLNKFLLLPETRQYFHPELQAEIEFGIEESKDRQQDDFLTNLEVFLNRSSSWDDADKHIVAERDSLSQKSLPCVDNFIKAVPHEVTYQYALWNEDYSSALEAARQVLTAIEGPEELRGYRAFWMYLAGNVAWLSHHSGLRDMDSLARDYYGKASKAAKGVTWLHELARLGLFDEKPEQTEDAHLDTAIEKLEQQLESLGTVHDRSFEKRIKEILDGLQQTEAHAFESAQVFLGRLLGYYADNSGDDSAPDPWWVLTETEGIVFEDYTDCKNDAVISTRKIRQAASHPSWLSCKKEYESISFHIIFMTSAEKLGSGARPVAINCYYWKIADFLAWAKEAIATIREIRRSFVSPGDLVWRVEAKEAYMKAGLNPAAILERARQTKLDTLPESKRR